MKRLVFALSIFTALVTGTSCSNKDDGGGGGGGCNETQMTVTSSPAANSVEPAAPGPNFNLTVNITNNLPTAGATIEVKARPEGSSTAFYTETKTATSASTAFTITATPVGVPAQVDITVTSKSCNTNKVTLSYKYSRK